MTSACKRRNQDYDQCIWMWIFRNYEANDITKLRYSKIVIMADADVDDAHISHFYLLYSIVFMPELIYEGHVYIAMPPLYKNITEENCRRVPV